MKILVTGSAGFIGGSKAVPDKEWGAAYDEAMQKRVFDPLGMKTTTFDFGKALSGDVAQPPMFSARDWDQLVADHAPPDALLVATDAGHGVIGYVAVHTEAGEIFLLFVHPAHAGRGVRRALLDAAHDVLRAAGHTEAFLFTEERNTRGRAVYAAAGYRPDGTVRESELHGVGLRELRLVKTL